MKRIISILVCVIMVFGMNSAYAEEGRVILALGDSISAGYGLNDRENDCFVSIMADTGDTVINKAVDGNKANDIIDQLTNENNENYISEDMIKSADIVTVTCGGNDMMDLLYEKIAEEYPNEHPKHKKMEKDEVIPAMAAGDIYAIVAALNVLDCENDVYYMNDGEFDVRLEEFTKRLLWITEYIRSVKNDVKIVVATQYNPYVEFEKKITYDVIYYGMEEGAARLNEAICDNSLNGGYEVSDVKSAFDSYEGEEDLYNADPNFSNISLDFHPTEAGHKIIAEAFRKIINRVHRLGIENADGTFSLPSDVVGYYITDLNGETRFLDAGVYAAKEGDRVEEVSINASMVNGAQVKLTGGGLRFLAVVDRSCFDAEGYGMVIAGEGSDEKVFVDAKSWQNDTCYTVAIENMAEDNYRRNYTAVPFVRVRYNDGSEKVIVGTKSVTRSIYAVAAGLLEKGEADDDLMRVLEEYIKSAEN